MIQFSRPWLLLAATLFYALGIGLCVYLSWPVQQGIAWLGWVVVMLLIASSGYLKVYFDMQAAPPLRSGDIEPEVSKYWIMAVAVTLLTTGAVLTVVMAQRGVLAPVVLWFLGLGLFLSFFWGTPPLRLVYSGYGELSTAILAANIVPALAYTLQTSELHSLLAMLTFPLTALWLAMQLALGLENYWKDLETGRKVLLVRMGWERGMFLHNVLLLSAFILLLAFRAIGLAWPLTWPGLLAAPVAVFQVWQMWQIGRGAKPRWRLLRLTAIASVILTAYFFTYALWTV